MTRRVALAPAAQNDLLRLYDRIAESSGPARALAYTGRVTRCCAGFADFPERGTKRDDLRPGLRTVGFERRVTIAFAVEADEATR